MVLMGTSRLFVRLLTPIPFRDAWTEVKGTTTEEAYQKYVDKLLEVRPIIFLSWRHPLHTHIRSSRASATMSLTNTARRSRQRQRGGRRAVVGGLTTIVVVLDEREEWSFVFGASGARSRVAFDHSLGSKEDFDLLADGGDLAAFLVWRIGGKY